MLAHRFNGATWTSPTNAFHRHGCNISDLSSLGLRCVVVVLHEREGESLLDAVVVGKEHDHTVNAHTPATGGRKTVLHGSEEGLVHDLGLVVTLCLLCGLLLEAETLVEGIVQLGVCVDNLLLADEGLETLTETSVLTVVLGERRHHLGVPSDECGVDAFLLDELANKSVEHTGVGERWCALDTSLLEHALQELVELIGVHGVAWRELLTASLLERRDHLDTLPGLGPVDLVDLTRLCVELGLEAATDGLDETFNKILSALHDIVDVGKSLVVLAGGEFGVVSKINALVTEDTAELVDLVDATNNKLLKRQLSGDAECQSHVKVVVVGPEGLSGGATGVLHEDGCLDLVEAVVVEVVADVPDDLRALDESVPCALVHDQVKVTVPVPLLLVLEAVVLGRNLVQAGCEEDGLLGEDGELARVGLTARVGLSGEALDTDDVASSDVVVLHGEGCAGGVVEVGGHDLALGAVDGHLVEAEVLARSADVVDAAGDADLLVLDLLTLLKVAIFLLELAQVVGDGELVRVGRKGLLGLLELLDSPAADLEVLLCRLLVASRFFLLANMAQCLLSRLTLGFNWASSSAAFFFFGAGGACLVASFLAFSMSFCLCFCLFFNSLLLTYSPVTSSRRVWGLVSVGLASPVLALSSTLVPWSFSATCWTPSLTASTTPWADMMRWCVLCFAGL